MSSSVVKAALVLAVLGVLAYDGGVVVVNTVQVDDAAGDVARAAARDFARHRNARRAEQLALDVIADLDGAQLSAFAVDGERLTATVLRPAPVLLLDRLPVSEGWALTTVTKQAAWRTSG